jgi:hypothetical protein
MGKEGYPDKKTGKYKRSITGKNHTGKIKYIIHIIDYKIVTGNHSCNIDTIYGYIGGRGGQNS